MKRLLIALLLSFSFSALCQQTGKYVTSLTKDSVRYYYNLEENWKFHPGDSAIFAEPGYDDSGWEIVGSPGLQEKDDPKKESEQFNSIGWLRLHVLLDSTITMEPLALAMRHYGASEIFIDGKRIMYFGLIYGKEKSKYIQPQDIPFILPQLSAGEHIISVRYANYSGRANYIKAKHTMAGFRMQIGKANLMIRLNHRTAERSTFLSTLLFGIFAALAFLHLFLFLYHRTAKSNMYFSIFCLSIAALFYAALLNQFSTNPITVVRLGLAIIVLTSIACFSFSAFANNLFGKRGWRTRIISILCFLPPILSFVSTNAGGIAFVVAIITVAIDSTVLTILAIVKKAPGARIIGFGILFLTLFCLATFILAISRGGNLSFSEYSIAGFIYFILTVMAVISLPLSMSIYLAWSFSKMNKDLKSQLTQVQQLSEKTLQQEIEKQQLLENRKDELEKEVTVRTREVTAQKQEIELQHEELKKEKKKSDDLLLNILPEEVADELKSKGASEARFFDQVTVIFTDFVDFTKAGERMSPQQLVDELHTCFKNFDEIISRYNIEKIKTIGDAYLAVCGLPMAEPNHAVNTIRAAMDILLFMDERKKQLGDNTFDVRIGIHTGSVVAGIVGVKKFAYDIWGDTVNTAARMEQHGERGKINISQVTYELVKDRFKCTHRGEITAKNKGGLNMYFVEKEI